MNCRLPKPTAAICLSLSILLTHSCLTDNHAIAQKQNSEEKTTKKIQWVQDGKVAGRTLEQWTSDFESDNEIVRARAAKTLGLFGKDATKQLVAALGDSSDAVKYWAAYGLGMLDLVSDDEHFESAINALKTLESNVEQKPANAMVAAYALCRLEGCDEHIDLLIEQVQIPDRASACSAADFLKQIGPPAKDAMYALRKTHKRHSGKSKKDAPVDYHIRGACLHAMRSIDPESLNGK